MLWLVGRIRDIRRECATESVNRAERKQYFATFAIVSSDNLVSRFVQAARNIHMHYVISLLSEPTSVSGRTKRHTHDVTVTIASVTTVLQTHVLSLE